MAVTLETMLLELGLNSDPMQQGLAGARGNIGSFAGNAGKLLGGALVGGATLAIGAIVGIGAAAVSVESEFKGATDAIINGTGATGQALREMQDSVLSLKGSAAGLNVSMEDIGATLAEVNTRTGATGPALETLTGQILEFSRLTGSDAVANTRLLTRVMGDWGIANEDAAGLLDRVYGAGQAFGISVDSLAGKVVQFGAPLRQMGFSLDESIAMLGKWEKEGVNTELVIGSLRIAAGKFADANVPLQEGLRQTMDAIKGAASESDALSIAMDTFGARAGPDMAAAIREGRFELDDAIATLQATSGNLAAAGEATIGWREQWAIATANIQTKLVPLGESLGILFEVLLPGLVAAIGAVVDALTPWLDGLISLIDYIGYTTDVGDEFNDFLYELPEPIQGVVLALGQLILWLQNLRNPFAGFKAAADTNLSGPMAYWSAWVKENMPRIQQIIQAVLGAIQAFWAQWGDVIVGIVNGKLHEVWVIIDTVMRTIGDIITLALQLLTGDWEGAYVTIIGIVQRLWNALVTIFTTEVNNLRLIFNNIDWAAAGQAIVDGIRNGLSAAWNGLENWWRGRLQALSNLLPFSEPKDPSSPLRGLGRSGASMVKMFRGGAEGELAGLRDAMSNGLDSLFGTGGLGGRQPAAVAGGGAMSFGDINVYLANGGYEEGRAAARGILDELRARGVK